MDNLKEQIVRELDRLVSECNENKQKLNDSKINITYYMKRRGIIINNYTEKIMELIK